MSPIQLYIAASKSTEEFIYSINNSSLFKLIKKLDRQVCTDPKNSLALNKGMIGAAIVTIFFSNNNGTVCHFIYKRRNNTKKRLKNTQHTPVETVTSMPATVNL